MLEACIKSSRRIALVAKKLDFILEQDISKDDIEWLKTESEIIANYATALDSLININGIYMDKMKSNDASAYTFAKCND